MTTTASKNKPTKKNAHATERSKPVAERQQSIISKRSEEDIEDEIRAKIKQEEHRKKAIFGFLVASVGLAIAAFNLGIQLGSGGRTRYIVIND